MEIVATVTLGTLLSDDWADPVDDDDARLIRDLERLPAETQVEVWCQETQPVTYMLRIRMVEGAPRGWSGVALPGTYTGNQLPVELKGGE